MKNSIIINNRLYKINSSDMHEISDLHNSLVGSFNNHVYNDILNKLYFIQKKYAHEDILEFKVPEEYESLGQDDEFTIDDLPF